MHPSKVFSMGAQHGTVIPKPGRHGPPVSSEPIDLVVSVSSEGSRLSRPARPQLSRSVKDHQGAQHRGSTVHVCMWCSLGALSRFQASVHCVLRQQPPALPPPEQNRQPRVNLDVPVPSSLPSVPSRNHGQPPMFHFQQHLADKAKHQRYLSI
ncbi:hypothetical protein MAA_10946 [Metarhizium robertsii ARSEF 23]|uniref:Uncharacterized protein n=1 Tax=Metarhizium robertsii (strain ARSEF 23 / ATCC MYA-3075) TaxID=655844 RepID=A0A0B2XFB3_METRA|nr:uncharacterized protein MAA_10946 [Metarhizium robertsii ARSEF 23]KHO11430.1 hypothetical protein MAA_10946 [Metarhizium robertsii ARSEF 23]